MSRARGGKLSAQGMRRGFEAWALGNALLGIYIMTLGLFMVVQDGVCHLKYKNSFLISFLSLE